MMTLKHWLEKAFTGFQLTDFDTEGGLLSAKQSSEFLRVAIAASVLMEEARVETSNAPKWEVPRISLASRVLKAGLEGERNVTGNRVKPVTGLVTLSTVLYRGEVPVSDEALEDTIERDGFADTLAAMVAEACGRDIEEYALLNNTSRVSGDTGYAVEIDQNEGLVKQLVGIHETATTGIAIPTAQLIADASTYTSFDSLFGDMIEKLPSAYRRNMGALRFYTSIKLADRYHSSIAARGTPLGDTALTDKFPLRYRGIPVVGIPMLTGSHAITTTATINMIYDNVAFLTDPKNIIFAFQRKIKIEQFRDPREGALSIIPSVRFDAKIADPNYAVAAKLISGL